MAFASNTGVGEDGEIADSRVFNYGIFVWGVELWGESSVVAGVAYSTIQSKELGGNATNSV